MRIVIVTFIFMFTTVLAWLAESAGLSQEDNIADMIPGGSEETATNIFSLVTVFWRMVSFQLEGVPNMVNFFIIAPLGFAMFVFIVLLIRGN